MNGGTLLVACLKSLGARWAFGVPGESYLPVLDALHDTRGTLDFVLCRQEGGAAYMAEACAKLTGKPGICLVTRGPGATNAAIGIHSAMQASTPLIVFVGQVGTDLREREAFQEVDYRAAFGPLAKWATEIEHVDRIPEMVSRAWWTALSGRPGPVVVALPEDVLHAATGAAPLTRPSTLHEPAPSVAALAAVESTLQQAERPLIIFGGSGWTADGRAALQRFAERARIPAVAAFRFQDLMDNASPAYAGEAGVGMVPHVKALIGDADVIIALNIRFGEMTTDAYTMLTVPEARQTLIHSHASDGEIGKIYVPDVAVHAGPNTMATALAMLDLAPRQQGWAAEARAAFEASLQAPPQPSPVDLGAVCRIVQARMTADAIITNGAGNFAIWPGKFLSYGWNQRYVAPQSGAMGYGVPAAVAAKIVHPDRQVICFAGDGDFQMNGQELGTAMQAGAGPIILIVNNGTYGTIRMHQEHAYPTRVSGTDLENPDFAALARAYNFYGERVETTDGFDEAFERALASPTGAVLDLNVSAEALTPRQTLSAMREGALARREGALGSIDEGRCDVSQR